MEYQTFPCSRALEAFVKCYWTLEGLPGEAERKQKILPDGCVEMAFILGDDIQRYVSETDSVVQPRALVIGPFTKPFVIEPRGYVNTFAVRFYPYGFCNFVSVPLSDLADKDTPLESLFADDQAQGLIHKIVHARGTDERIRSVEQFLTAALARASTMDRITKTTVDLIVASQGRGQIGPLVGADKAVRQIERNFLRFVGMSPKKLGRAIRFQAALAMVLDKTYESLTHVAYENGYFDQAHFIHDFKAFTGTTPRALGLDEGLLLSGLFSQETE